jgi:predicted phosphoribosyltransferase
MRKLTGIWQKFNENQWHRDLLMKFEIQSIKLYNYYFLMGYRLWGEALDKLFNPFAIRVVFKDRQNAGQMLANKLDRYLKTEMDDDDQNLNFKSIIVLGIPRGGLIVAHEVAKKLCCELDLVCPTRIVATDNETTIGCILYVAEELNDCDNVIVDNSNNKFLITLHDKAAQEYVKINKSKILAESYQKSKKYQRLTNISLEKKIIILIDDGIFSGASALTALQWLTIQKPKKLIFATPVAPKGIESKFKNDPHLSVDHIEILKTPSSRSYKSVDCYYKNFKNVNEADLFEIMEKRSL